MSSGAVGAEGATPLMYACQQASEADIREIIRKKPASVKERDRTLKSALHYCAESASPGAVCCAETVLAAAPQLLDARDEDGYSPLHLAVISGNCALVRALLARGADVNCLDNERHSVVHWATVCGEVEALETVLSAGGLSSTPDLHGGYPLHYAAQMCGPDAAGSGARLGLAVLRTLLAHGVDVAVADHDGRQPILWAASAGSADAILALVNAGANVEADDKDGLTALHCAASRGHTDCLETLVSLCGAAVDVMDSNGCTALFYAVTLGHADATRLLLDHGAQPNRQDRKGRTPAHCGAAKGQLETLRILTTRGANMWARNVKGDYPLHEAVSSGRKELVRWLLSQRPDAVNASNNDGRCPLHVAAINDNVEMCKILLDGESLVNPVMRASRGSLMTPLDAALHKANRNCAKYLQLHGGVPASRLTSQAAALRGSAHRVDPHSDQVNTPEWNHLMVPELRGVQSLVPSPVERLTVVDSTRTVEVRVEDEILHRRASESSNDDKVRRRRRKRRSKRDGSELETDSSDRHTRRRRRVREERNDTSDEEDEMQSRRRRRKGRKGKISDESVSEDASKKKKKDRKSSRRGSVGDTTDHSKNGKENIDLNSKEDDKEAKGKGEAGENKNNETIKENLIVVKEEIKTKEYTKSKKVTEHREEEQSLTKPTLTKKSKTTCEETKTEEQITTKTSEIISTPTPNESKDNETSTQEENNTAPQLVTAIVHQEESKEQGEQGVSEENINGSTKDEQTVENDTENIGTKDHSVEAANKDQTPQDGDNVQENVGRKVETESQSQDAEEDAEEIKYVKLENETAHDDDGSFWGEEESEQVPPKNAEEVKENVETDEPKNGEHVEEAEAEPQSIEVQASAIEKSVPREEDTTVEGSTEAEKANVELSDTEIKASEDTNVENANEILNSAERPTISEHDSKKSKDDEETQHAFNVDDTILTCIGDEAKLEKMKEESVANEKEDSKEDEEDLNKGESVGLNQDESIKGLVKVLGRSEVDDGLSDAVKVDKISSDALKERSRKSLEEPRGRSRRGSSFEIVSPARSMLDDECDSETPRSRSRVGTDSQLHDSGFEPSPRRDRSKESRIPRACRSRRRSLSSHGRLNDSDDDRPELSTVSVTQAVQHSMRKYHLERRIFHELLELKRLQIRAGRSNEAVLVKRLVDDYRRAGLWIGLNPYEGHFTFKAFEKYLYDQLRLLQNSDRRIIPRLKSTDDLEKLTRALRRTRAGQALLEDTPLNPMHCTHRTHRCFHATHAYTGVPCAAYIGKVDHHTMAKPEDGRAAQPSFLPRIDSGKRRPGQEGQAAEIARCLRYVDPSRPVTLELSHGSDRQLISLPTEKLDKNKRYYVTFTIKGGDLQPEKTTASSEQEKRHRHAKSF